MKNKKGLVFKNAFVAIIIVSLVVIAVGIWVNDWNTQYSSGLTYDLQDFDELDSMSSQATSQKGNLSVKSSFDAGTGATNFEGTSLRGVFSVLNNIFTPFKVVFGSGGMLDAISERWGLPDYIRQGIIAIILFTIIYALVAILFRIPGGKT